MNSLRGGSGQVKSYSFRSDTTRWIHDSLRQLLTLVIYIQYKTPRTNTYNSTGWASNGRQRNEIWATGPWREEQPQQWKGYRIRSMMDRIIPSEKTHKERERQRRRAMKESGRDSKHIEIWTLCIWQNIWKTYRHNSLNYVLVSSQAQSSVSCFFSSCSSTWSTPTCLSQTLFAYLTTFFSILDVRYLSASSKVTRWET